MLCIYIFIVNVINKSFMLQQQVAITQNIYIQFINVIIKSQQFITMPRQTYKSKSKQQQSSASQIKSTTTANQLTPDQQQLLTQLIDAVRDNQPQTIHFLLQDQTISQYDKIIINVPKYIKKRQQMISEQNVIKVFQQIWMKVLSEKKERKQREYHDDNIRKINQEYYGNQGDQNGEENSEQLFTEKKKDAMKIQDKFGYIYYGNVKCLMIAYGDLQPLEQSVKIMHSQVQMLYRVLMENLSLNQKNAKKKQHQHQHQKQHQNNGKIYIANKCQFRQYLQKICKEQVKDYEQISKVYKKVKNKAKANPRTKRMSSSSSDSNLQEENQSNAQQQSSMKHMQTKDKDQIQYFVKLTENMDEKQYKRYSQCRSTNFLYPRNNIANQKKLLQFIDPSNKFENILQSKILELCSFIGCRFIKKIMFDIIKEEKQEKNKSNKVRMQSEEKQAAHEIKQKRTNYLQLLQKPLNTQLITSSGNFFLDFYTQAIKNIIMQERKHISKAQQLFLKQINNPKLMTQMIPKQLRIKYQKDHKGLWKDNKYFQISWTERVKTEQQIDQFILDVITKHKCKLKSHEELPSISIDHQKQQIYKKIQQKIHNLSDKSSLYTQFILRKLEVYYQAIWNAYCNNQPEKLSDKKLEQLEKMKLSLFQQYTTGMTRNEEKQGDNNIRKPRKRVKLESLKN